MPMKKYIIFLILAVLILFGAYQCPLYSFWGIPCPACGMTRAYKLFFSGNFAEAFFMHPLFWMPPFFLFKPFQKKPLLIGAVTILILVYILRLVLFFPHTPPMNYNYNSILGEFFK